MFGFDLSQLGSRRRQRRWWCVIDSRPDRLEKFNTQFYLSSTFTRVSSRRSSHEQVSPRTSCDKEREKTIWFSHFPTQYLAIFHTFSTLLSPLCACSSRLVVLHEHQTTQIDASSWRCFFLLFFSRLYDVLCLARMRSEFFEVPPFFCCAKKTRPLRIAGIFYATSEYMLRSGVWKFRRFFCFDYDNRFLKKEWKTIRRH